MFQFVLAVALSAQVPPSDKQVLDALPSKGAMTNVSITKSLIDFPTDFTSGVVAGRWACVVSYTEVREDNRIPRLVVVYLDTESKTTDPNRKWNTPAVPKSTPYYR